MLDYLKAKMQELGIKNLQIDIDLEEGSINLSTPMNLMVIVNDDEQHHTSPAFFVNVDEDLNEVENMDYVFQQFKDEINVFKNATFELE